MGFVQKLGVPKLIGALVVVVAVVIILVMVMGGDDATQLVLELPETTLTVETPDQEIVELEVREAVSAEARETGFSNVDPETIANTILLIEIAFSATSPYQVTDLRSAIDIAFFDEDGQLMSVQTARPDQSAGFSPDDRYKYILLAREGLFEERGITPGSQLVL